MLIYMGHRESEEGRGRVMWSHNYKVWGTVTTSAAGAKLALRVWVRVRVRIRLRVR